MKKGLIISILAVLLVISLFFDNYLVNFIVNYRNNILTDVMHFVSFLGSAFFVIIASTLLFCFDKKGRKYIPALLITFFIAVGLSLVLKYLIIRPRPLIFPLENKTSYSFPSTHAAAVFAPLILVDKLFPKLKWFWLTIAILVLFSRFYLGVHYISDVIGGALIGYIIGIVVLRILKINF